MNITEPKYIISAATGEDDKKDQYLHKILLASLRTAGYGTKELWGCYKGKQERSILVLGVDQRKAINIGKQYNQESILEITANNDALLIYTDGSDKIEHIGKLKQVSEEKAKVQDAYTFDHQTGKYYVAV